MTHDLAPEEEDASFFDFEHHSEPDNIRALALKLAIERGGQTAPVSDYDVRRAREIITGEVKEIDRLKRQLTASRAECERLRAAQREASRDAGLWEDAHRELLNAVMACCDPENRVCGLHPGQERDDLEEVISRHHTAHRADGPLIAAALTQEPANG